MAKRLLFIDVSKGAAILGVILVHALIVGVWFIPSNALAVLPTFALAILSPLVIISTWAGFFELMSGLANMYQMYDRLVVREMPFKKAAQGPFVNSTGLLLVHFMFISLFSHRRNPPYPEVYDTEIHTLVTGSLELGRFYPTDFQYYFFASVLGSIAIAGYFAIILIWLLYKINGLKKINQSVILLTIITAVFWVVSYPIWDAGYAFINNALLDGSVGLLIVAFPLAMLTGAFQPFFPIAGFAIVGATIGLLLAVENSPESVEEQPIGTLKYMRIVAISSFVLFVVLLVQFISTTDNPLSLFDFFRLPPPLLALNVSLMLAVFRWAIKTFELPDEETRKRRAEQSLFIRRFGMITLTVYVLESPVNGFLSFFYHRIFDDPSTELVESHVAFFPIIGYTALVIAIWFGIVLLWEKAGFKYSIEYWIIRIGGRFRATKSQKLDLVGNLYHPLGRPKESEISVAPVIKEDQ